MAKHRPETPADIAAALSPSQRRALLWLPADGGWRLFSRRAADRPNMTSLYTLQALRWGDPAKAVAWTASLCAQRDAGPWDSDWSLTPLGQAVRAVLAAGERHG